MNASPFLLLLFCHLFTCHGEEQHDSPASSILATTKAQKKIETPLCPEPSDIEPCECADHFLPTMDCSKVQDEEQLRKVFSAFFPSTEFSNFYMTENKGVKVLENGVFGNVSFQMLNIWKSALQVVMDDALTPSLSTLTTIWIQYCQLATFPFERLSEFTSLEQLSVVSNQIHSLPPLSSLSLRSLTLNYNPISQLDPDVFTLLPAVEDIYLWENYLTEITPGTFRGLPKLYRLTLVLTKISYLQTLTFDLASSSSGPTFLTLKSNNIDYVEVDAFKGVAGPSTINMAYNALTRLAEEVWRPVLEKDITVMLEGNPLSCGCDVAWLVRDHQMLAMVNDSRCADGTLLTHLDPADFDVCG